MKSLPSAKTVPSSLDEEKLNKKLSESNLTGLSNNIKWDKLISYMRDKKDWKPSYRSKLIEGYISDWDVEWSYHLPFPFKGVLWFDISCTSETEDHSKEFIDLVERINFDYIHENQIVRIFGYSPKDYEKLNE